LSSRPYPLIPGSALVQIKCKRVFFLFRGIIHNRNGRQLSAPPPTPQPVWKIKNTQGFSVKYSTFYSHFFLMSSALSMYLVTAVEKMSERLDLSHSHVYI
jgi:hypothetical protein